MEGYCLTDQSPQWAVVPMEEDIYHNSLFVSTLGTMHPIYTGQAYRYSTEYTFSIFSQQIYLIIFLDFLSPSSFIHPQNAVYFPMLPFLVHKIFTFYINGALNCKCPAPGPKG